MQIIAIKIIRINEKIISITFFADRSFLDFIFLYFLYDSSNG